MKLKTILISQPEPANENSPYTRLKEKHNLKIDFRFNVDTQNLFTIINK